MSILSTQINSFPHLGVHTGKILVVDDESIIREMLSMFLEKNGYVVDTAEDGNIALKKIEENIFDVVITDLRMPKFDGRELLKVMQEKFNHIPRIVLTGLGSNEDILLALKTGAYDFLSKPITDYNLLIHAVQRALERKKLADDKNRAVVQLSKINHFISQINSGVDTEEIFKMIDLSLKSIIPFNFLALVKLDENEENLHVRLKASEHQIKLAADDIIPLDEAIIDNIRAEDDIFIISDLSDFLIRHSLADLDNGELNSAAVMRLVIDGKIWGFLIFASEKNAAYNEEHDAFLCSIAGHIALSIQRGELLTELEIHTRHLEHLVKVRTHEVLKTQKKTIFALSKLAEMRDEETGEHLERIRSYSVMLAQLAKYSGKFKHINNEFLRDIYDSSILHDIGKVGIPDVVLLKQGTFNPEEYSIIQKHTTIGYDALQIASKDLGENSFLDMAKDVVLYHHERWDGQGYPTGLTGEEIPLAARIVAIADVYDALTSVRPYKGAIDHFETMEIMRDEAYRFDPILLQILFDNNGDFDKIRRELS